MAASDSRSPQLGLRTRERNSVRVSFWRKQPTMALVTVEEFCFLDAAHHHAQMARLDDDAHALRIDGFLNGVGDLAGEPLLHLQAASKHFNEARDLAEADHLAFGDVGDVDFAEKGQHVVFAEREHLDVFHDDHLVVVDVEHGAVQNLGGVFVRSPW
jgi:hypothetical protein